MPKPCGPKFRLRYVPEHTPRGPWYRKSEAKLMLEEAHRYCAMVDSGWLWLILVNSNWLVVNDGQSWLIVGHGAPQPIHQSCTMASWSLLLMIIALVGDIPFMHTCRFAVPEAVHAMFVAQLVNASFKRDAASSKHSCFYAKLEPPWLI